MMMMIEQNTLLMPFAPTYIDPFPLPPLFLPLKICGCDGAS